MHFWQWTDFSSKSSSSTPIFSSINQKMTSIPSSTMNFASSVSSVFAKLKLEHSNYYKNRYFSMKLAGFDFLPFADSKSSHAGRLLNPTAPLSLTLARLHARRHSAVMADRRRRCWVHSSIPPFLFDSAQHLKSI